MRNFSNIYILFLFVTFCWIYYDVSFVQFYLHSEFLLNLVVTSMLGKWKGHAKESERVTRITQRVTRRVI